MARKATKATATRNASLLRRTHLTTLALHTLYLLLRALVFRRSYTRACAVRYALLAGPALAVEWLVLERGGRPVYDAATGAVVRAGDDLEAAGLMEFLWDVVYWTWGVVGGVAVFGEWVWWGYVSLLPFPLVFCCPWGCRAPRRVGCVVLERRCVGRTRSTG